MPQRVTILGSTGSIGSKTLQVIKSLGSEFHVVGLAAGRRWRDLAKQAADWAPSCIALGETEHQDDLKAQLPPGVRVFSGPQGLVELVEKSDCDLVVSAIVGTAGLLATVRAVQLGKRVAIANKETLVVAGPLITAMARRSGAELIPVDSEHSAIFQAMHSGEHHELHKIYLTSSGGPFRTWPAERIREATLNDALNHPVWDMGPKITIDSAGMMNKALEIVEARWLFDVPSSKIGVLIHPEAIVHSLVEFCDGCLIAQLGTPDMRVPIQYALTYPRRLASCGLPLDITSVRQLNFEPPDEVRFPALRLGFEVARRGGTAGAVLNAANETAVEAYRAGRIAFGDITELCADVLKKHDWIESPDLNQVLAADTWTRNEIHAGLLGITRL